MTTRRARVALAALLLLALLPFASNPSFPQGSVALAEDVASLEYENVVEYNGTVVHRGDLVVNESDFVRISNCTFVLEDGAIIVYGKLVLDNSTVLGNLSVCVGSDVSLYYSSVQVLDLFFRGAECTIDGLKPGRLQHVRIKQGNFSQASSFYRKTLKLLIEETFVEKISIRVKSDAQLTATLTLRNAIVDYLTTYTFSTEVPYSEPKSGSAKLVKGAEVWMEESTVRLLRFSNRSVILAKNSFVQEMEGLVGNVQGGIALYNVTEGTATEVYGKVYGKGVPLFLKRELGISAEFSTNGWAEFYMKEVEGGEEHEIADCTLVSKLVELRGSSNCTLVLSFYYSERQLSEKGLSEDNLFIAMFYDESRVEVPCVINKVSKTVSTSVTTLSPNSSLVFGLYCRRTMPLMPIIAFAGGVVLAISIAAVVYFRTKRKGK